MVSSSKGKGLVGDDFLGEDEVDETEFSSWNEVLILLVVV